MKIYLNVSNDMPLWFMQTNVLFQTVFFDIVWFPLWIHDFLNLIYVVYFHNHAWKSPRFENFDKKYFEFK